MKCFPWRLEIMVLVTKCNFTITLVGKFDLQMRCFWIPVKFMSHPQNIRNSHLHVLARDIRDLLRTWHEMSRNVLVSYTKLSNIFYDNLHCNFCGVYNGCQYVFGICNGHDIFKIKAYYYFLSSFLTYMWLASHVQCFELAKP